MKVFLRAPRRWVSLLASKLGCESIFENKQMFQKNRSMARNLIQKIFNVWKGSSLPPLEWFIQYDRLYKVGRHIELIVEPGSKIINTKKDYLIYVENSLGLFGYNTRKINSFNIFIFRKILSKSNFKGFVFYSETARSSTRELFKKINLTYLFENNDLGIIYPITPDVNVSEQANVKRDKFKLLFCSSSFNLKGGRELVEAINKSKFKKIIKLILITNLDDSNRSFVNNNDFCEYIKFDLTEQEYIDLCLKADLIIHPTFFDTHALSLLEGIKCGKPAIATNTFALKEYIEDSKTGRLIENPYEPYDKNGCANFYGVALKHALSISKLPINKEFSNKLA
ncbi:TPA: glycosyltransferase, partial [Escherichia coli]